MFTPILESLIIQYRSMRYDYDYSDRNVTVFSKELETLFSLQSDGIKDCRITEKCSYFRYFITE